MSKCAVCHEPVVSGVVVHSECVELLQKTQQLDNKPLTNADRIRAMSDEELSEIIMCPCETVRDECLDKSCVACCLEWLKQSAEVE